MHALVNRTSTRLACAAALLVGSAWSAAASDEGGLLTIKHLVTQARYGEALPRIESFLEAHPEHAEARFLKGLVLAEQGRQREAVEVFEALTRDYPGLPEPHNNLAVLYAAEGDYAGARRSLLTAVKTYPGYATAHENLGDVYARMASVAYGKALEINVDNDTAKAKLDMVHALFSARGPGERPGAEDAPGDAPSAAGEGADAAAAQGAGAAAATAEVAAPDGPAAHAVASQPGPATEQRRASGEAPGEAPGEAMASAEAAPAASEEGVAEPAETSVAPIETGEVEKPEAPLLEPRIAVSEPTADALVASARAAADGIAIAAVPPEQRIQAVRDTLSAWARAWSAQNVDEYLSFYHPQFEPAAGLSREHWEILRRTRVSGPEFIRVRLDDVDVDLVDENHASVIFSQHYRSDSYRDTVQKTLTLVWDGLRWRITGESALD